MGSCHSSNSKPTKKKLGTKKQKSKSLLNESIDEQFDSLTLKNNDLSAYIDLNSSIFQKHSPSMSSLSSTNSSMSSDSQSSATGLTKTGQPRTIPVLSRLVYKPNIVTSSSSIVTTGSSKNSALTKSLSTSPPSSPNASIEVTTHIKIENVQDPKIPTPKKVINRREFSPFRSFLKPPTAIVNQSTNVQKSTNFSSNSSLTKHNQSSSLSSLSSTSSSISATKNTDNTKPKTSLLPPKKLSTKTSPTKTNLLPSPSKLKNSNTNIPLLNANKSTENTDKPAQNKRLFSPYKFSSSLQKPSVLTENINRDNSNLNEIKKSEQPTSNVSKENSSAQLTGISKLKFSYNKIPAPSKSNIKTISQTKVTKITDNNNMSLESSSSLLKRDDSAYNSSTSSTVSSSNDTEDVKEEKADSKIAKPNANRSKTSIEESVGELNQLIVSSSSICSALSVNHEEKVEQKDTSVTQAAPPPPIFKPPSNLPPVENGEVIVLDIETYRLLMQDLQSCKLILHKLGAILKEPSLLSQESGQDSQFDEMPNSLLSSFYQHNNILDISTDKIDQSTQTD